VKLLTSLRQRAEQSVDLTPQRWVIVRLVHPIITSTNGYYAIHDRKVFHFVQKKTDATPFLSESQAMLCAKGSDLDRLCYYKIERL
jgi:hypothetical protein